MSSIKRNLKEVIKNTLDIDIQDEDLNLLSERWGVSLASWLYVIYRLEEEYYYPVTKIIKQNGYEVFTLNNLAQKIEDLMVKSKP